MRRFPSSPPSGFALIAVLWMLILISALAVGAATTSQTETRLAANVLAVAQARHLAEGGILVAVKQLIESDARAQRCLDGRVFSSMTLDQSEVDISVRDEAGKIDLNEAAQPLLRGLFSAAGKDPQEADALADAVLDWRDGDHERSPNGAEDSDYRLSKLGHGAKDARFESIYELLSVKGITRELFDRIRDDITVHSRVPTIDPKSATALALAAVPGYQNQVAREFVALRGSIANCADVPPPPLLPSAALYLGPSPGLSFTISAAATIDGAHFTRQAIVGLTFRRDEPFQILGWGVRARSPNVSTNESP